MKIHRQDSKRVQFGETYKYMVHRKENKMTNEKTALLHLLTEVKSMLDRSKKLNDEKKW